MVALSVFVLDQIALSVKIFILSRSTSENETCARAGDRKLGDRKLGRLRKKVSYKLPQPGRFALYVQQDRCLAAGAEHSQEEAAVQQSGMGVRPSNRVGWASRPSNRVGWASRPSNRVGWASRPLNRVGWASRPSHFFLILRLTRISVRCRRVPHGFHPIWTTPHPCFRFPVRWSPIAVCERRGPPPLLRVLR